MYFFLSQPRRLGVEARMSDVQILRHLFNYSKNKLEFVMKAIKLYMFVIFLCLVNAKLNDKISEIQEISELPENLVKNSQQKLIQINTKNTEKSAKSKRKIKNKRRKGRKRKNENRYRKHKGIENFFASRVCYHCARSPHIIATTHT